MKKYTMSLHKFVKPGVRRAVHAWFLRIALSMNVGMCVCVCVCLPPRLLITSGVMWCDIDSPHMIG